MTTSTIAWDPSRRSVSWPPVAVVGVDRAIVRLYLRLSSVLGDWPGDTTIGLPVLDWMEAPRPTAEEVEAVVRVQIEAVDGLTVDTLEATVSGTRIDIAGTLTYTPDVGDAVTIQIAAPLYPASSIDAWYVTTTGRAC
jgi:hypothetical protein